MADIELVIKIPEEMYKARQHWIANEKRMVTELDIAIANGTPLPEGHGDLIDRSKINKAILAEEDNCAGMGMTYEEMGEYNDGINAMYNLVRCAKSIIKAEKEGVRTE